MTDELMNTGVSRGAFLKRGAVGGLALVGTGGVLAAVAGPAFASSSVTKSDIATLQAAYTAESLAVYVYTAAIQNHAKFKLQNLDYFTAARADEVAHKDFLGKALGSKTPTGLSFKIPAKYLASGKTVLELGRTLETAFIAAYLGAVKTFSSTELKEVAAQVAANEASHFSFFDAALGGHAVTAALPKSATIPATVNALKPFLG
jgi:Ferritin-like domain